MTNLLTDEIIAAIETHCPKAWRGIDAQSGLAVGALATGIAAILTAIKLYHGEEAMERCAAVAVRIMLNSETAILGKVLEQIPTLNARPS